MTDVDRLENPIVDRDDAVAIVTVNRPQVREGTTAFLEKRAPRFKGK